MSPWATLEGMLWLAQVLVDLGESAEAGQLIDEGQNVLSEFPDGVNVLRARLDRLRRQLAARPRVVAYLGNTLTEREVAVLRLLRGSMSLREISQELYVSPNTVKTHAQAIYRKLGVSSRQDAVLRGRDAGVL